MRVCYTSDFHGSELHYESLGRLLGDERPKLAILGGDMFADGDDRRPAESQAERAERRLTKSVGAWKRDNPDLSVAVLMGNHDWLSAEQAVRRVQETGLVTLLEPARPWTCGGVRFLGFPYAPPSPHWLKDYERLDLDGDPLPEFDCEARVTGPDGVLAVDLETHFRGRPTLAAELALLETPADPWILVAHAPPYDTKLDRLPEIPEPIGSRAVKEFIRTRRPLCALHGHVHESPEVTGAYHDDIGGVLCVNPGQARDRLYAVLFDTDDPRETLWHTVFE